MYKSKRSHQLHLNKYPLANIHQTQPLIAPTIKLCSQLASVRINHSQFLHNLQPIYLRMQHARVCKCFLCTPNAASLVLPLLPSLLRDQGPLGSLETGNCMMDFTCCHLTCIKYFKLIKDVQSCMPHARLQRVVLGEQRRGEQMMREQPQFPEIIGINRSF